MNNDLLKESIFSFLIPFIFVALLTPIVKKIAIHVKALDIPNYRKVHTKPIPRLGGLAIVSGFLFGYMIFCSPNAIMNSIFIGGFIIVITGIVDDICPVPARYKFLCELAAITVIVFYGGLTLSKVTIFGYYIDFKWFTIPLTYLFLIGSINCINLIDGLDGLAAGTSSIYFLSVIIISLILQRFGVCYSLSLIMLGCCFGFLIHNFHPASIFMGDSGSMFLGYVIGIVALLGFRNVVMTSLIVPLLLLAIPLLDSIFALTRRKLKGQSITYPDKCHIHHQLLKKNISHKNSVLLIYLVELIFSITSIIYVLKIYFIFYILCFALLVLIIIFILNTDIIYDFKNSNKKGSRNLKKGK